MKSITTKTLGLDTNGGKEEMVLSPNVKNRALAGLLSGAAVSAVIGQLFAYFHLGKVVYCDPPYTTGGPMGDGCDSFTTTAVTVIENRFHSPGWWIISFIGFVLGFYLAWKYAFRQKRT